MRTMNTTLRKYNKVSDLALGYPLWEQSPNNRRGSHCPVGSDHSNFETRSHKPFLLYHRVCRANLPQTKYQWSQIRPSQDLQWQVCVGLRPAQNRPQLPSNALLWRQGRRRKERCQGTKQTNNLPRSLQAHRQPEHSDVRDIKQQKQQSVWVILLFCSSLSEVWYVRV